MIDTLRPAILSVSGAFGFNGSLGVIAQTFPGLQDNILMQLLEKGGGWVVLLVVLWSYKRDWQRIANSEAASRAELIKVLAEDAEAKQSVAVALAENTEVLRQLSSALLHVENQRRHIIEEP